jgi:hypothetical protein
MENAIAEATLLTGPALAAPGQMSRSRACRRTEPSRLGTAPPHFRTGDRPQEREHVEIGRFPLRAERDRRFRWNEP